MSTLSVLGAGAIPVCDFTTAEECAWPAWGKYSQHYYSMSYNEHVMSKPFCSNNSHFSTDGSCVSPAVVSNVREKVTGVKFDSTSVHDCCVQLCGNNAK